MDALDRAFVSLQRRDRDWSHVLERGDGRRMPPHNQVQLSLEVGGVMVEGRDISALEELLHLAAQCDFGIDE